MVLDNFRKISKYIVIGSKTPISSVIK